MTHSLLTAIIDDLDDEPDKETVFGLKNEGFVRLWPIWKKIN